MALIFVYPFNRLAGRDVGRQGLLMAATREKKRTLMLFFMRIIRQQKSACEKVRGAKVERDTHAWSVYFGNRAESGVDLERQ